MTCGGASWDDSLSLYSGTGVHLLGALALALESARHDAALA